MSFDLAWMAGFFDGEGSIYINSYRANGPDRPPILQLTVTINNTNRQVLEPFLKYGGCIVSYQPKSYNPKWRHRQIFRWGITAFRAASFLHDIFPYLRLKGPVAHLGLEFQGLRRRGHYGATDKEALAHVRNRIKEENGS